MTLLTRQLAFFNADTVIWNIWLIPKSVSPERTVYTTHPGGTAQVSVGAPVAAGMSEAVIVGVREGPAEGRVAWDSCKRGVAVTKETRAGVDWDRGCTVAGNVRSS